MDILCDEVRRNVRYGSVVLALKCLSNSCSEAAKIVAWNKKVPVCFQKSGQTHAYFVTEISEDILKHAKVKQQNLGTLSCYKYECVLIAISQLGAS